MEIVYHASLALEAHLVSNLLEQAGIPSRIDGEYLQGAAGELPLGGLVTVRVAPEHAEKARQLIAEWEKRQPPDSTQPVKKPGMSWAPVTFLVGCALGFWVTPDRYDIHPTMPDERYLHEGRAPSRVEWDRNSDGRADVVNIYDSRGRLLRSTHDDDFDARIDRRVEYDEFEEPKP
jgi:hypothetical protein